MTLWAAYVTHGMEFDLVEDCTVLGVEAVAPRKVEAIRTGNRRWPEARITPYLPNYVFVSATPEEWHWLREIRYVRDIMGIGENEARLVREFIATVETQFAVRRTEIDRAEAIMRDRDASKAQRREAIKAMQHYQPGDMLEVITGPFAGQLVRFGQMVERANATLPEIEVALDGLQWGNMRMDPLSVKKAS